MRRVAPRRAAASTTSTATSAGGSSGTTSGASPASASASGNSAISDLQNAFTKLVSDLNPGSSASASSSTPSLSGFLQSIVSALGGSGGWPGAGGMAERVCGAAAGGADLAGAHQL